MTVNGLRVQAKSQTLKSAQISSFINNMKHSNPVAIIIGKLILSQNNQIYH